MEASEVVVGKTVIYWANIKRNGAREKPKKTVISSEPVKVGRRIVCKIKGKSEKVSIKNLDAITPGSITAARLAGSKEFDDQSLVTSIESFFKSRLPDSVEVKVTFG